MHTNALAGIYVRALSAELDHRNILTTLNVYSHALQSLNQVIANTIENIIQNKNIYKNCTQNSKKILKNRESQFLVTPYSSIFLNGTPSRT